MRGISRSVVGVRTVLSFCPSVFDRDLLPSRFRMVDAATLDKLEAGFKKISEMPECKHLTKKNLTKEIFDDLKNKLTPMGSSLLDCVQSGFANTDAQIGIYAADPDAYKIFSGLFDKVIQDYHMGFKVTDVQPACDFGNIEDFVDLDPTGEFIISTRVRCGRSLAGFPLNPRLTEAQYKEMESKVSEQLKSLDGGLKGQYYPLSGMDEATKQKLIDDHFLFKEGDRFLREAQACRFWPTGRGIFHNDKKTFLVWINEEDHLRIISMQMGGNVKEVFARLQEGARKIETKLPFARDDRLGFITFCPTNLGTTIRASVHIKLPKIAKDQHAIEQIASKYNLQVRGTRGEHTESEGGVYDISNKRRIGLTEYQAVKEMQDGVIELIKLEKAAA